MDGEQAAWDAHWQNCRGGQKDLKHHATHRRYFHQLQEAIRQQCGTVCGIETLELGCGRGTVSQLLSMNSATVSLLDASGTALDIASGNFKRNYTGYRKRYLADAREVPCPDKSFDVVFSIGLLEHFADPTPALSESLRLATQFAWHVVINSDKGNDKWYRSNLPPSWYEEQGWTVVHADSPHIFTIRKDARCRCE